ncbi:MAG: hypothetical protein ACJAVR_002308 [Paracoccaceae bacterium]|jgi:hypothetical protein
MASFRTAMTLIFVQSTGGWHGFFGATMRVFALLLFREDVRIHHAKLLGFLLAAVAHFPQIQETSS